MKRVPLNTLRMCYYLIAAAAPPASGAIPSPPSASAKHGTGAPFPYSGTSVPDRDIFSPDYCTYAYILLTLYLMRALSGDTQVRTPAFRRYDARPDPNTGRYATDMFMVGKPPYHEFAPIPNGNASETSGPNTPHEKQRI